VGRKLDPKIQAYAKADGSVSYRVRVRANGRQTTETFQSLAGAETFVRRCKDPSIGVERAVELRDREDSASPGYVLTVREALHKHVAAVTGIQDVTREDYIKLAERSWLKPLGSLRVDDPDMRDLAGQWINAAAGSNAPKTIKNQLSVLVATLGYAVDKGMIPANPVSRMRVSREAEEDVEDPNFLTHAEFNIIYAEIPEYYRPLVAWLFGTGMRWSEATALQRKDLTLDAGTWTEDGATWLPTPKAQVVRSWKKGGKIGPPKSKASRRSVLLPDELVAMTAPLVEGLRPGDWLFTTITGKPVRHANFFNRIWKPATLRASVCAEHREERCRCFGAKPYLCGLHAELVAEKRIIHLPEPCGCAGTLPFRPRIHDARHTHASWLIAQGIGLEVIQERLGHEDYLTTRRLYAHLMPDAQLNAMAAASIAFARTSLSAPAPRELG
jgi:integrase